MKTRPTSHLTLFTLGILVPALATTTAFAQYSIDWHTIDGGGDNSTGGDYAVSGSIGQADAEPVMIGGSYTLTGGFWVLPTAVQTEGVPRLTILPAASGWANISWFPASTNFALQEAFNLEPATWMNSVSGSTNPVVVPASGAAKFYRLFKP